MRTRSRSYSMSLEGPNYENSRSKTKESIFELKELQNLLKYEWPQTLKEDSNPIELAVALLDDTSVGLAHKFHEFDGLSGDIHAALRHVVNDHHELFNNSVGSYHLLLSALNESQEDCSQIKELLETTTREVHDRSDVLNEMNQSSMRYGEIIEILDAVEELNSIPNKIEQLVADKKIHLVYDYIHNAYEKFEKYNLSSMSAMNGIQSYLETQSNNLFNMIVDELQAEIYLKNASFSRSSENSLYSWQSIAYSDNPKLSSFKNMFSTHLSLEQFIYNSANIDVSEVADCFNDPVERFISSQLDKVHTQFQNQSGEVDYSVLLDSSLSPLSESFHYIYMLLHTAFKMNRLGQVLEVLLNNNQLELHALFDRTTEEVKHKNAHQLAKLSRLQNFEEVGRSNALGVSHFNDVSVSVLQDLFSGIFITSLAVLQKHRIVTEVMDVISQEQRVPGEIASSHPQHGFNTVWNVVKRELQTLMNNYIYTDLDSIKRVNEKLPHLNHGENSRELMQLDLFKLDNALIDNESVKSKDELQSILENMFPGFMLSTDSKPEYNLVDSNSPYIRNETLNAMVEVLVSRNLLNMRIILDSLLIFIAGSEKIFSITRDPQRPLILKHNTAILFFTQFMKMSFLSQLRESLYLSYLNILFDGSSNNENEGRLIEQIENFRRETVPLFDGFRLNQSLSNLDASTSLSAVIFQNASDFKEFIMNVCYILNTSLSYRPDFTDLVLELLDRFAGTYSRYYEVVLSGDRNGAISGLNATFSRQSLQITKWLRALPLIEVSIAILLAVTEGRVDDYKTLCDKELKIIFHGGTSENIFDISKDDSLDYESISQVCCLFLTSKWILSWLPLLKRESNKTFSNEDGTVQVSPIDKLKQDWCFLESGRASITTETTSEELNKQDVFISVNAEKMSYFNGFISAFETIRNNCILTLRYDLRCKAIYYIGNSFRQGEWFLVTEPADSDQYIGQLSKELFALDNKLSTSLEESEIECIFVGFPEFVDELIIKGSEMIKKINNNGIKRIMLNILTLQQTVKNLMRSSDFVDFSRSSSYYNLFTMNEYTLLKTVKSSKYSLRELHNMARLVYSEKLADGNGSSFNKSKYSDLLKKLEEVVN